MSDFRFHISYFRLQISYFRFQTSEIWFQNPDYIHTYIGAMLSAVKSKSKSLNRRITCQDRRSRRIHAPGFTKGNQAAHLLAEDQAETECAQQSSIQKASLKERCKLLRIRIFFSCNTVNIFATFSIWNLTFDDCPFCC